MKILESIIWLSEKNQKEIENFIPGFVPIIRSEIAQSLRMPYSDEYIWNYYLLDANREEDQYLFQSMEENIISHVFLLTDSGHEQISRIERLVESFSFDFEQPPLFFFHFIKPSELIDLQIQSKQWQLEKNIFISWHRKFFPLLNWNKTCVQYIEKIYAASENG